MGLGAADCRLSLIAGLGAHTAPTDYTPIKQMKLRRVDGKSWVPLDY